MSEFAVAQWQRTRTRALIERQRKTQEFQLKQEIARRPGPMEWVDTIGRGQLKTHQKVIKAGANNWLDPKITPTSRMKKKHKTNLINYNKYFINLQIKPAVRSFECTLVKIQCSWWIQMWNSRKFSDLPCTRGQRLTLRTNNMKLRCERQIGSGPRPMHVPTRALIMLYGSSFIQTRQPTSLLFIRSHAPCCFPSRNHFSAHSFFVERAR